MNIKDLYRIFMRYKFDKQLQQDGVRITVLFDIILFNTYIILYKIDDREKSIKVVKYCETADRNFRCFVPDRSGALFSVSVRIRIRP